MEMVLKRSFGRDAMIFGTTTGGNLFRIPVIAAGVDRGDLSVML